jgi:radical SAM/Cys-rich protein
MRAAGQIQFEKRLQMANLETPFKERITTLQVNMGKLCNQSCAHCHVGANPGSQEIMTAKVAGRIIELVENSPHVEVVDITGGAPELNPNFPWLGESIRRTGRRVIDRCNLTVLTEKGMEQTAAFLAQNGVDVVASLPCYTAENVDGQRGKGVFEKSIAALRRLNRSGYGMPQSDLNLDLVYNPGGAFLPGPQKALEEDYKNELARGYDIRFNRLLTIVNMPICRFAEQLEKTGEQNSYMSLLYESFNPATVAKLMCRSLVSISWAGRIHDCDFNQMLEIPIPSSKTSTVSSIFDLSSLEELEGKPIATASHCFGCTAGAGSSCQGSLK